MKRILASVLIITLCLFALVSCDLFPEKKRVSCKEYENCAVFTLDYFEGSYSVELSRTGLGEGAIYYQINLEHGRLTVNYKDAGFIHSEQPLGDFTADDEMPIISSGGYIEGDKIEISFGTLSPVKGEIIIAFTEDALKAAPESTQHEHTTTYVCNEQTHQLVYTCGCPSPDIAELHDNDDGEEKCEICGYTIPRVLLRDCLGCEWISELSAEEIAEIRITRGYLGVEPGRTKTIQSTTEQAVIARIVEECYSIETVPIFKDGMVIGGWGYNVRFVMKDGSYKTLYANNGRYIDENWMCFRLLTGPYFKETDAYTSSYSFNTYRDTGAIYSPEGLICEIDVDELEFIETEYPATIVEENRYIDAGFGKLIFVTTDIFYREGKENIYYQLVGKNLDEMIAYATSAEYSLTMNDEEWLYEDLKATYKAGETVSVKIEMAIDLGYLFLVNGNDIADCQDVDGLYWEFTFTMPACNVEIDFKTYDGFLPDRNYGILIESYWKQNLDADYVYIENYYGEFSGGAIVAMIASGAYDDAVWEETVGDTTIRYNNENRILVLYEGEFYTLTAAYENGYLSLNDLEAISDLQKEYYPCLY